MATPYSVAADVRKESPFKNTANIDSAYITQCIAEADSIIDSYIGIVYTLPLATNPPIIASLSKDIAICLLFMDQNPNIEVEAGVTAEDRYKRLLGMLDAISKRKELLIGSDGLEPDLNGNSLPSFFPNDTSSDPTIYNNTASKFSMNKIF